MSITQIIIFSKLLTFQIWNVMQIINNIKKINKNNKNAHTFSSAATREVEFSQKSLHKKKTITKIETCGILNYSKNYFKNIPQFWFRL